MACPPDPLVSVAELPRYGVPAAFLAGFRVQALEVTITTAGVLGVMGFAWRNRGESDYSGEILSAPGPSWVFGLDEAFAMLTFAPAVYVIGATYIIGADGTVAGGAGELVASRYDLPANLCSAKTDEALTLMRSAVTPPLVSWGDAVRNHAAALVYAALKRARGATPATSGGDGDQNVFEAERRALAFFIGIGEGGKPDSIIDTSSSTSGPMFRSPVSRPLRGWQ
jgi:hypothetical protein